MINAIELGKNDIVWQVYEIYSVAVRNGRIGCRRYRKCQGAIARYYDAESAFDAAEAMIREGVEVHIVHKYRYDESYENRYEDMIIE